MSAKVKQEIILQTEVVTTEEETTTKIELDSEAIETEEMIETEEVETEEVETTEIVEDDESSEQQLVRHFPKGTTVLLAPSTSSGSHQQQIFIIQTPDGNMEGNEVVMSDDLAVFETVSALEQLSRGHVIATTNSGEQIIQVYEEVVIPESSEFDVAEVEVGDGRSASPVKIGKKKKRKSEDEDEDSADGEFHICRTCNQFVPIAEISDHHHNVHAGEGDLKCSDCGKMFKSKRSLFGHKKEKHSGTTEIHTCPECGKTFGRKSNLKAHRDSLHYGKKFPCQYCERIFTNRSSMNQHVKKTHMGVTENNISIV